MFIILVKKQVDHPLFFEPSEVQYYYWAKDEKEVSVKLLEIADVHLLDDLEQLRNFVEIYTLHQIADLSRFFPEGLGVAI